LRESVPAHFSVGTLPAFAFALLAAATPCVLHLLGQPLAMAACVALAATVALKFEAQAYILVLTANIFQNLFVTALSPNFSDIAEVEPLKLYSVVTTGVVWFVLAARFWFRPQAHSALTRRIVKASTVILALASVYYVFGLAINPRSATIYMRNVAIPIFLLQSFMLIASRQPLRVPQYVSAALTAVIVCGYLELLAPDAWFTLINGWTYFSLSYAQRLTSPQEISAAAREGVVITGYLDYTATAFLNSPLFADLNLKVQRLLGPNFHPISFGYLLASLIAFAAAHRRYGLTFLALPLLFMTNAKGPITLALFTLVFQEAARRRHETLAVVGLAAALAIYGVLALLTGLSSGDYHVLGLIGGLNGFLQNPIGHSLGDGGNLSVADFATIDWSKFQNAGAADIAVESAVGVMFYQLGVAAFVVVAVYLWLIRQTWRLFTLTRAPSLAFSVAAISTTLVNGFFQEEAWFSPLSLGLALGLTGLSLGAADRALALASGEARTPETSRPHNREAFARPLSQPAQA